MYRSTGHNIFVDLVSVLHVGIWGLGLGSAVLVNPITRPSFAPTIDSSYISCYVDGSNQYQFVGSFSGSQASVCMQGCSGDLPVYGGFLVTEDLVALGYTQVYTCSTSNCNHRPQICNPLPTSFNCEFSAMAGKHQMCYHNMYIILLQLLNSYPNPNLNTNR